MVGAKLYWYQKMTKEIERYTRYSTILMDRSRHNAGLINEARRTLPLIQARIDKFQQNMANA